MIRESIIKYFPDRECVTLPRPVEKEEDLRNLKYIPFENLKPNFRLEYSELKNKIFKETKCKRFKGKAMNGPTLANFIIAFIDSMNNGFVPNITNTWDSIVIDEINNCFENSIGKFKSYLKSLNSESYEQEELLKLINKEFIKANISLLDVLKKNPDILYNDKCMAFFKEKQNSLMIQSESIIKKLVDENYEKTKK